MRTSFTTFRRLGLLGMLAGIALVAGVAPPRADDTAETLRLAVSGEATFSLKENPSTGYRWHLDTKASRNLDLIEISDAGYRQGGGDVVHQPMVGVPGTRSFRIIARKDGTATAVFDYLRDWENQAPAQRHTVTVEIAPR
ncbi:protease inhibitor I42 family protein [Rhodopseudomonas palustris]|jgi:inhibitor of cysteine peptidase|uniref:protease inhibitor I42 family protein n=1 Tax=Rhodopseudomonas palustris TaxID=1076 RepID=UPI000D1B6E9B|nr:protease inhibitor I42 family protein [Rhodopseudomonas palustris]